MLGRMEAAPPDREREILYRVIEIASSSLHTETVLASVVDLVSEAVACDTCFVYLLDRDGRTLVLRAASPAYERSVGRVRLALGEGVAGWAAENRESVLLHRNAMADPRYRYSPELEGERFEAMLSIPIISRAGALIGIINVHAPRAGAFTEEDLRFVEHTASLVAGGIENAELYQLAARKEEALAALVRKTILAQEEERRRVAIEIHDGVTQQLVSIWFRIHACQRLLERRALEPAVAELTATKELIDQTLADARAAIYNLRPATLDDLGLVPALSQLAGRFHDESGVEVALDAPSELRLSPHLETAMYRIAQESLTNVRKHAGAQRASVSLGARSGVVTLTVSDDGCGFDAEALAASRSQTSFGLAGMRERVELVGGRLAVRSAPGRGTTLTVEVPVPTEPGEGAA